jgi:ATP-binding cassette subfamily B protein
MRKFLIEFKLFLKFARYLLPYWKKEAVIISLSGIGVLLGLVNPYLTKLVIDRAFGNRDLRVFIILALIGGGIFVLNGLLSGLDNYLNRQTTVKVNFDLNKRVFRHLEKLDLDYFRNRSTGEHIYRINYDIERVTGFITTTPPQTIVIFPKLLFVLGVVFYLNWKMALLSLILAPFLYLPNYYYTRRMRKVWKALIENSESIFKSLQETLSHMQLVKVFGKETQNIRRYLKLLISNIRISMKNVKLEIFSGFASSTVNRSIIGLIAFYGGYQVIKGQMSLGSLTAIMVYLSQLIGLQGQFANFFQTSALGLVSCQRLTEVLDEKATVMEIKQPKKVRFQNGRVIFQDVSFGYRANEPVLRKVTFDIEGGSHIAIAGSSGCGKSTLLNLLLRLYDPWSGDITIDRYRIKELSFNSLKGQIGMALQEPFLLNDTVKMNIAYGIEGVDEEEIIETARICGVDSFVARLPDKYQTIIGENACKMSEGQKQKIAIARALIKRPKILILDEAFSSMDSASEEIIIKNIRQAQKGATLIVVSHRLSTILKADLVYFFNQKGDMIIDTPQNLMAKNAELVNLFSLDIAGSK